MTRDFAEWFLEIENHGTRAERFYDMLDDYNLGDNLRFTAHILEWLKAAYESGLEENSKIQ